MNYFPDFPETPPTADKLWVGLFVFGCFILILILKASFASAKETARQFGNRLIAFSFISLAVTAGLILILFASNSETNRELFLKLTLVQGLVGIVTFIIGILIMKK